MFRRVQIPISGGSLGFVAAGDEEQGRTEAFRHVSNVGWMTTDGP